MHATTEKRIASLRHEGFTQHDSERIAHHEADEDRARLAQISPRELSAAEKKIEQAQAALESAERELRDRKQTIAGLEHAIIKLGEHRAKFARWESRFSLPSPADSAAEIFSAWDSTYIDPSPVNESRFIHAVWSASFAAAIAQHVKARRAHLIEVEAAMLESIQRTAKEEKVNLTTLLATMRTEARVQTDQRSHVLFESGHLNGIA